MSRPVERQKRSELWEAELVPSWTQHIEPTFVAQLERVDLGASATVLVAESRTGTLIATMIDEQMVPPSARLMVVDPSSDMLDVARRRVGSVSQRVFYSSQSMTSLSYADGVFNAVLCPHGLLTRGDLSLGGAELLRVLQPDGVLAFTMPLAPTFECFVDMLEEAIIALEMRDLESPLSAYREALIDERDLASTLKSLDLSLVGMDVAGFDLEFEGAAAFLTSPLVDDLFLPRWLAMGDDVEHRETLLTEVLRMLDTYYASSVIPTQVEVACVVARRA